LKNKEYNISLSLKLFILSNVLRLSVRDAMLRAKSSECSGGAATTNTTSSTTPTTELKHDLNERCLLRLSPSRGKGMLLTYLDAFILL
jgi:hypothetical protein